jgi:hypothetical protein
MSEADVIAKSLSTLGNYRVKRTQKVAAEGPEDGISGSLLLALTLRETWGRNIEGGAKPNPDPEDAKRHPWVALDPNDPDDVHRMDVGAFQINRGFHKEQLQKMLAVRVGTWAPVVAGKTPYDGGYAPRFEDQLQFTIKELRDALAYARSNGVKPEDRAPFAIAAHNAGKGGALKGYREGDVDKYTALGNYSADILAKRTEVNHWLNEHPNWKI